MHNNININDPLHKKCKYCQNKLDTNSIIYLTRDNSFCSDEHRTIYTEEHHIRNTKNHNNKIKKYTYNDSDTATHILYKLNLCTYNYCTIM